jgi:tryptophanyl-tRNA synthetase
MKNKDYLDDLLKSGAERAQERARKTLTQVYDRIGLVQRK